MTQEEGDRPGTVPADAEPVEGVPGYYTISDNGVGVVFGPEGQEVGRLSGEVGDRHATVDGVRIPLGYRPAIAAEIIARHHLASADSSRADRVHLAWTMHKGKRVIAVRGTIKDNAADQEVVRSVGGMKWSPVQGAHITGTNWKPRTRDEKAADLLAGFARQGRNIRVVDETAPTPPKAAGSGPSSDRALGQAPDADQPPGGHAAPVSIEELSDEDLAEAINKAADLRYAGGLRSREPLTQAEQALFAERRRRVHQRMQESSDLSALDDDALENLETWAVQQKKLHEDGRYYSLRASDRKPERELAVDLDDQITKARAERQTRMVRGIPQRPPVTELDDAALEEERSQRLPDLLDDAAKQVVEDRKKAARAEQVARQIRAYEDRPAVDSLDTDALHAELVDLYVARSSAALSGVDAAGVRQVIKARMDAIVDEQNRRAGPAPQQRVQRADVETDRRFDRNGAAVTVDGLSYGRIIFHQVAAVYRGGFKQGWNAAVGGDGIHRVGTYIGGFASPDEAVAAVVDRYDSDPKTEPVRVYGRQHQLWVPKMFAELYRDRRRRDGRAVASQERRTLYEMFKGTPSPTHGWDWGTNPLTGDLSKGLKLEVPAGLLAEFGRAAEELSSAMMLEANDRELPSNERSQARSRLKAINAALHVIEAARQAVRDNGGDDDRKAISREDIQAQQAALRASLHENGPDGATDTGERDDDEHLQQDSVGSLGPAPAEGTGQHAGSGGVLPGAGAADSGGDRAGRGGAGGGAGAGAGLSGPGGAVEPDPGDRAAAGAGRDAAAARGRAAGAAVESGAAGAPGDQGRAERAVERPFHLDQVEAPTGPHARASANLEAIDLLKALEADHRGATTDEKLVLARFSGWGSVPIIFADEPDRDNPVYQQGGARYGKHATDHARWLECDRTRQGLRAVLSPLEWARASRATLSAHYTPPAIAAAMWDGLGAFGVDGGEFLDAGSGVGVFTGTAPEQARVTMVELDPTAARIAQKTYPHATVLNESFADTDAKTGTFDAAIGNVPFADVPFTDRRYGATGQSLHNGFIIKALALTRPPEHIDEPEGVDEIGGVVIVISSRWTLDAKDPKAREKIAAWGDLVCAFRLPAGTFSESAGTDVTADVLVFRRLAEGEQIADRTWLHAPVREVNGSQHTVNSYFDQHPEHVLGKLTTQSSAYGPQLTVKGDPQQAATQLRDGLMRVAAAAGLSYQPHPQGADRPPLRLQTARDKHAGDYTGRLYEDDQGRFWQHINGDDPVPVDPADGRADQLRALMGLRDVAAELRDLDRTGTEQERAGRLRGKLRDLHTAYIRQFGPLSRPRQTRVMTVDGQPTPTAWGWFREDPDAATVRALETWNAAKGEPELSLIFTERAAARAHRLEQTDDPKTALAAVAAATGRVDLAEIGRLLNLDPWEALRRLEGEVFTDPATGDLELAKTYLSGPVRIKLDQAREAADKDPAFALNVAALEKVQPRERTIGQFTPELGEHWSPPELVQGFLRDYLGDRTLIVSHNDRYGWLLQAGTVPKANNTAYGVLPDPDAGTKGKPALAIARALLGYGSLTVYRDENRTDVDEFTTRLVRQKADKMRAAYAAYATATSDRLSLLTESYNRIMNGNVVANYDDMSPTLEGLTHERTPHWWQLAGAARMLFEPGVILAHEVGLGKTTTLMIGLQALKASGQISKPFVVCPDNIAKQWYDEATFLYPNADIRLITSNELAGDNRARTLEWLRASRPDLVIYSEPAFASIKLSPEAQEEFLFRELDELREQINRERDMSKPFAQSALEKRLAHAEARIKRNDAPLRRPGEVYWDDLEHDYGVIDEVHRHKGTGLRSKEGGGETATIRGIDTRQKLGWMHHRYQAKRATATAATGTPLVRSIQEEHGLLDLTAPHVLDLYKVRAPDLWAAMFGRKVLRAEMAPDGSGLRMVERFAEFNNKLAMKTMWGLVADTRRADDVGIPRPNVKGGQPRLILVPPTKDQKARMRAFVERGRRIHAGEVTRYDDNMLMVSNEATSVALDPRLVDADAPAGNKLSIAAELLYQRCERTKDIVYKVDGTDEDHPEPGALQLVFMNEGVPGGKNKGNFNAYEELRALLVNKGMPAEKIAFIHDYLDSSHPEKIAEFCRKAREGAFSVVIGSTPTMGHGLNLQTRVISVTHLDLDWGAAAMEQRNGRGLRTGNQNPEDRDRHPRHRRHDGRLEGRVRRRKIHRPDRYPTSLRDRRRHQRCRRRDRRHPVRLRDDGSRDRRQSLPLRADEIPPRAARVGNRSAQPGSRTCTPRRGPVRPEERGGRHPRRHRPPRDRLAAHHRCPHHLHHDRRRGAIRRPRRRRACLAPSRHHAAAGPETRRR